MEQMQDLPPQVQKAVMGFLDAARSAFGGDLVAAVLFGSAAEGKLRATSDVNLLLVLGRFERAQVDAIREPLRMAHAAVNLSVMFLLEGEIEAAADAFAVKFSDILSRHRVLYGSNPFADKTISREAAIGRLRQVLLNLQLRLRERYAMTSLRPEQLVLVIAEAAAPLRAAARTLLELEGCEVTSPKEALAKFVAGLPGGNWQELLSAVSTAREQAALPAGVATSVVLQMMQLLQHLQERAGRLA